MRKTIDLNNDPIKKLFSYYLFSSVFGIVIKSVHTILDGIFVSNGVGPEALAAVSIYLPLLLCIMAITTGIAMGGSTVASIRIGEQKFKSAQSIFMSSMILIFLTGVVFGAVFLVFPYEISRLFGANDVVIEMTVEYGIYISYFLPLYTLFTGLAIFVRNDRNPTLSMVSMIASAVVNMILNYVFIFRLDMALKGAAVATGISQVFGLFILMLHFTKKDRDFKISFKNFRFLNHELKMVFAIGFPTFINDFSYAFISVLFNIIIMRLGGEIAVSAFTIMIYITTLLYNIYVGMGQGMQPVLSFNFGAGDKKRVYESYHLVIMSGVISSLVLTVVCLVFNQNMVLLFNRDNAQLIEMATMANKFVFFSMPFVAINIIVSIFFQSIGKFKEAAIINTLRGIVLLTILIFLLSETLGLFGVWLVYPVSEVISFGVCLFFMLRQKEVPKIY